MENRTMYMHNGMVYGENVSEYGLEKGKLDYATLARIIGPCIFNGTVRDRTMCDWDCMTGELEEDEIVCSDYLISRYGYEFLREHTDELVFYNEELELYIWAVKHWGTDWSYVTTNIKLVRED